MSETVRRNLRRSRKKPSGGKDDGRTGGRGAIAKRGRSVVVQAAREHVYMRLLCHRTILYVRFAAALQHKGERTAVLSISCRAPRLILSLISLQHIQAFMPPEWRCCPPELSHSNHSTHKLHLS